MSVDPLTLAAILAMAVVTFACRAAGYLVLRRIAPGPGLRSFLGHVPGALFVAFTAPAVVAAGPPGWVGALATTWVMRATSSVPLALAAGVGCFWIGRLGFG